MDIRTIVHKQFNHVMSKYQDKLSRPEYKFLRQTVYGILSSRHVHLNKIGSVLGESIRLKKTAGRLSRHLGKENLWSDLLKGHLAVHRRELSGCEYLIGDISDISKTYATCMDGLERVHDGSKGEVANGYWLMNLVGVDSSGDRMIPAYSELYALKHTDELLSSENSKILSSIDSVQDILGKDQIFVFDRGGDRRVLLEAFLKERRHFIIRQTGTRDLHTGKTREALKRVYRRIRLDESITVTRCRHGKIKRKHFDCGAMQVYLPREQGELYWQTPLWLVVAKQKGRGYCWFLCHLPTNDKHQAIKMAMRGYGLRWKIEEIHRQIKSDYHLEAVCLQRYVALKNFNAIFWITMSMIYHSFHKWRIQLLTQADIKVCYQEKWWEYTGFVYYKIAKVIANLLTKIQFKTIAIFRDCQESKQLAFEFT